MTVQHSYTVGNHATANSGSNGTTFELEHHFGPNDTALLVSFNGIPSGLSYWSTGVGKSYTEFTHSVVVGDQEFPLILLEARDMWIGHVDGYVLTFGLIGASVTQFAGTVQTIKVNQKYTLDPSLYYPIIHGASSSYSGAVAFNHVGLTTNRGTGSISIASGVGHMAYSAMGSSRWLSGNGNLRYLYGNTQTSTYEAFIIQDHAGASPTVTAEAYSPDYGALALTMVDMVPGNVDDPPVIMTATIDPLMKGVSFSQDVIVSGTAPVTLTTAGTLPPGITFDPNAKTLAGIPTVAGTFQFSIKAVNSAGQDERLFFVTVDQTYLPFIPTTTLQKVQWKAENGLWYDATVEVKHDDGTWIPAVVEF